MLRIERGLARNLNLGGRVQMCMLKEICEFLAKKMSLIPSGTIRFEGTFGCRVSDHYGRRLLLM